MSKTDKSKLGLSFTEAALGLCACLSIILILIPKDLFTQSLEFTSKEYQPIIFDDKVVNGASIARWIDTEKYKWQCELIQKFPTPFCTQQFLLLDKNGKGFDLSVYNQMTIWGNYEGNASTIRIILRNRHPNYYQAENEATTKYNMIEIPVDQLKTGFTFNMEDFGVADWWLVQQKIPLKYSHPDFNDVNYIEVQTGSTSYSGTHTIQINKFRWTGNLVSNELLYKSILLAWTLVIFFLLLYRMISIKIEISQKKRHQQELQAVNKLLNLQNKEFEDLAKMDQLTGLLNRFGIRDALYNGLKSWKKRRVPFSFILVDIDHFKSINDTYGHDVGDKILKGTADLFSHNTRRSDYIARWGGEEFILACHDTDLYQAQMLAELLRKKLEDARIHDDLKVTASFGVASLSKADLDHLFKCTDDALYAAKTQGRNRVVAAAVTE